MKLSEKQQIFTRCVAELINFATAQGWGLTFGDAYRDPRLHGAVGSKLSYSSANSCHKSRLAVDFNLFVDGKYITGDCEEYQLLGKAWEGMSSMSSWGGRFSDYNHFSFEHNGYK